MDNAPTATTIVTAATILGLLGAGLRGLSVMLPAAGYAIPKSIAKFGAAISGLFLLVAAILFFQAMFSAYGGLAPKDAGAIAVLLGFFLGFLLWVVASGSHEYANAKSKDAHAESPEPFGQGWLEARLLECPDFARDQAEVRANIVYCEHFLHDGGIFTQDVALRFLGDEWCRATVWKILREELNNPTRGFGAYAYCKWGPRLHRAAPDERAVVIAHLRAKIRGHLDPETGQEMSRKRQIAKGLAEDFAPAKDASPAISREPKPSAAPAPTLRTIDSSLTKTLPAHTPPLPSADALQARVHNRIAAHERSEMRRQVDAFIADAQKHQEEADEQAKAFHAQLGLTDDWHVDLAGIKSAPVPAPARGIEQLVGLYGRGFKLIEQLHAVHEWTRAVADAQRDSFVAWYEDVSLTATHADLALQRKIEAALPSSIRGGKTQRRHDVRPRDKQAHEANIRAVLRPLGEWIVAHS